MPGNAVQYLEHAASRKKDGKLYIAKGTLDVDDTNVSTRDGPQDILLWLIRKNLTPF